MKTKLAILALCTVATAQAQNDNELQRDVEVVNTYMPTISNPQKMHRSPVMDDTMSYKPTFKYSILSKLSSVKTDPDSIRAATMNFPRERTIYKSMVKGGAGNVAAMGRYFYNIGTSEDYHLSLGLGHQSTFGKVKLDDDSKADAPLHETDAGIDFGYFFGNHAFAARMDFENTAYRYYGLSGVLPLYAYASESSEVSYDLGDDKQRHSNFGAAISLCNSKVDPHEKLSYRAAFGFDVFSTKTGVRETDFSVDGRFLFPFNETFIGGIDASLHTAFTSVPDNDAIFVYERRKHTDVQVAPQLGLDFDNAQVRFGVRLIAEMEADKDDLFLQPEVSGNMHIAEGIVTLFARIYGDYRANTYKQMMLENPYVMADENVHSSNDPFVVSAGLRARFSNKVSFMASATYGTYEDEHFWINKPVAFADGTVAVVNRFTAELDDGKLFKAHGELNITPGNRSFILLTATYFNWDNNYITAWHKPQYTAGLDARFFATPKLLLSTNVNLTGERKVLIYSQSAKLDMIYDVNLEAEYFINSRWTAFVRANNVAACKYVSYYGYNVHSFNAMGGLTFKF